MGSLAAWEGSRSRRPRDGVDRFGGEGRGRLWGMRGCWRACGAGHMYNACVRARVCARGGDSVCVRVRVSETYICDRSMTARCTCTHTWGGLRGGRRCIKLARLCVPVGSEMRGAVGLRSAGRMDVDRDRRAAEWDGGSAQAGRGLVCVRGCVPGWLAGWLGCLLSTGKSETEGWRKGNKRSRSRPEVDRSGTEGGRLVL